MAAARDSIVRQLWTAGPGDPLGLGPYLLATGWLTVPPRAAPEALIAWQGPPTDRIRLDLTYLQGFGPLPSLGFQVFASLGCQPGQLVVQGNLTPAGGGDAGCGSLCTVRGWPCDTWVVRGRIITPGAAPLVLGLAALVDWVGGDPIVSQDPDGGLLVKGAP